MKIDNQYKSIYLCLNIMDMIACEELNAPKLSPVSVEQRRQMESKGDRNNDCDGLTDEGC